MTREVLLPDLAQRVADLGRRAGHHTELGTVAGLQGTSTLQRYLLGADPLQQPDCGGLLFGVRVVKAADGGGRYSTTQVATAPRDAVQDPDGLSRRSLRTREQRAPERSGGRVIIEAATCVDVMQAPGRERHGGADLRPQQPAVCGLMTGPLVGSGVQRGMGPRVPARAM